MVTQVAPWLISFRGLVDGLSYNLISFHMKFIYIFLSNKIFSMTYDSHQYYSQFSNISTRLIALYEFNENYILQTITEYEFIVLINKWACTVVAM